MINIENLVANKKFGCKILLHSLYASLTHKRMGWKDNTRKRVIAEFCQFGGCDCVRFEGSNVPHTINCIGKVEMPNENATGFYIVSLKHTNRHEKFISLWRPNNCGYCYSKENAGLYIELEENYHNSESNIAISVAIAEQLFEHMYYDNELKDMIQNNARSHKILGVKMTKNGLKRIKPKKFN